MIILEAGPIYAEKIQRSEHSIALLALGDTVLCLSTQRINRPGRPGEYASWYEIKVPEEPERTGWIPAYMSTLPGDPRVAEALRKTNLPEPPVLQVRQTPQPIAGGFDDARKVVASTYRRHFGAEVEKQMELLVLAVDYNHAGIRKMAGKLNARHEGSRTLAQLIEIYEYSLERWQLMPDPTGEISYTSASESVRADFKGDRDDLVLLTAALLSAVSFEVMITTGFDEAGPITYCEVYLGDKAIADDVTEYLKVYTGQEKIAGIQSRNDGFWLLIDGRPKPFIRKPRLGKTMVRFNLYESSFEVLPTAP